MVEQARDDEAFATRPEPHSFRAESETQLAGGIITGDRGCGLETAYASTIEPSAPGLWHCIFAWRGQFETGLTAKFKPPPLSMLLPKAPLTNELPIMPEQAPACASNAQAYRIKSNLMFHAFCLMNCKTANETCGEEAACRHCPHC